SQRSSLLLFVAPSSLPRCGIILRWWEQPRAHVVRYCLQPLVADALAVHAAHMRGFVPHDVVGRRLILRLVGYGAEGVSQRIEALPFATVDLQLPEQLGRFLTDRVRRCILRPR